MRNIFIVLLFIFTFLYGCTGAEVKVKEAHKGMSNVQLIEELTKVDKSDHNDNINSLIHEIHNRSLFDNMTNGEINKIFKNELYKECADELYYPYKGSVCQHSFMMLDDIIYIQTKMKK